MVGIVETSRDKKVKVDKVRKIFSYLIISSKFKFIPITYYYSIIKIILFLHGLCTTVTYIQFLVR